LTCSGTETLHDPVTYSYFNSQIALDERIALISSFEMGISKHKPTFYEQVTGVKFLFFVFPS
jgi:hypothetical protein